MEFPENPAQTRKCIGIAHSVSARGLMGVRGAHSQELPPHPRHWQALGELVGADAVR